MILWGDLKAVNLEFGKPASQILLGSLFQMQFIKMKTKKRKEKTRKKASDWYKRIIGLFHLPFHFPPFNQLVLKTKNKPI